MGNSNARQLACPRIRHVSSSLNILPMIWRYWLASHKAKQNAFFVNDDREYIPNRRIITSEYQAVISLANNREAQNQVVDLDQLLMIHNALTRET